jgi:hypothetical protein
VHRANSAARSGRALQTIANAPAIGSKARGPSGVNRSNAVLRAAGSTAAIPTTAS